MVIQTKKTIHAFTIAELAIVTSIIALVIGLLSGGKMLVKNGTIRAVISESQHYTNAINNFITTYGYYPGDFPYAYNSTTASSIWGTVTGCTSSACNGNGDGTTSWSAESFLLWLHLRLAGMISGNYTGLGAGAGNIWAVIGTNVPGSKYSSAGYIVEYCGIASSFCSYIPKQMLTLGGQTTAAVANNCATGIISKFDAYNIDNKIDDGMPITGNVRVRAETWSSPATNQCATGTAATSTYNFSVTPRYGCALVFKI